MEEDNLIESIEVYNLQLSQVEEALQNEENENNEDLLQLRGDLKEIIALTEDQLQILQERNKKHDETETTIEDDEKEGKGLTNTSEADDNVTGAEDLNDICGTKCSVLHSHAWGGLEYRNALIFSIEPLKSDTEPKVNVLFCHPSNTSMMTCPYFLDHKCRFSDEECRFNHGFTVNVRDLHEYRDPDYSALTEGASCLSSYTDGLWYEATVVSVDIEEGQVTVKYDVYDEEHTLDLHDIFPKDYDSSADSSSYEDEMASDTAFNDRDDHSTWRTLQTTGRLGEWEQYTKGVGSKLMRRMGYIVGQGLGRDSQGRCEPVPIQVLPSGKSLDKIMELKEQSGEENMFDPFKKGKKVINKKKLRSVSQNSVTGFHGTCGLFKLINEKIGHKKADIHSLVSSKCNVASTKSHTTISKQQLSLKSDSSVNIQLYKTEEEIKTVKIKMKKLKESLSRNNGREAKVCGQIKQKLASLESYLKRLESSSTSIEKHRQSRKDMKKLTTF